MDTSLKHRLIEIVVDKGLLGLLIVLAGFLVNSSLERYKLLEAQRVNDTSELVRACSDIWTNVYAYEASLGAIDRLKSERWIVREFDKKNSQELKRLDKAVRDIEVAAEQQIDDIRKLITERRFVIGDDLVRHYWQYIGFLKMRAKAEEDSREESGGESRKNAQEVVAELDKQLAAMRFTAMTAREHAISRLPH